MSYVYDAVGNRTQRTDYNGVITNYAYDNLNRITTINYPTRSVTYSYDPLNNLTRAANDSGTVYIGYDNRYRVSSFSDPFFYGISYAYDASGNRTKVKVNGAAYATYTYDAVNRLTSLKDSANMTFAYTYDNANKITSRTAPNGVATSYAYDGLDRLTSLIHSTGTTTLSGHLYTYNDANSVSSWVTGSNQRAYSYDAGNRLTGMSDFEIPRESYSYDGIGNRTASHLSSSYSYQPFNKLVSTANASYAYDNNGNLITKADTSGTTTYNYDEENLLTQVTAPNGLVINYKYDALGRRIQRTTTAGADERYVYNGADVLLDLNADWSVANTYFNEPGIDNHLRQASGSAAWYFLTDQLGSTSALIDANANVIEQSTYDSFGNSGGSARSRYGYAARERDPDTGLLYYRARFYDPQVGRFISEDPMQFASGNNFYRYGSNVPLDVKDPSGRHEVDVHYYLTYYLAMKTGCFSPEQAKEIANADQGVDENSQTSPGLGNTQHQRDVNAYYHALHGGSHQPYLDSHWKNVTSGAGCNLKALGIYLHYLQDTFSHAGFTDPVCGHGCFDWHYPDKTDSDVDKAFRMALETWYALKECTKLRGCKCQEWQDASWKEVREFNATSGGPDYREINAEELDRKRRILGVPIR